MVKLVSDAFMEGVVLGLLLGGAFGLIAGALFAFWLHARG